ncbi:MAG TPA: hypothetical protein VNY52_12275 [Solirubrobacteraceae bacterium]|nr:hypothetical protein [Solirubrobacteraceae bacterium]
MKNFVPLVQNLLQRFSAGAYTTLPDLARLSKQDWEALVKQTGAPPSVDAAGEATPAEVFASVVYSRVMRAYPTAALAGRIAAGAFVPHSVQQPLSAFFNNNPDLELLKMSIPANLATCGEKAFAGIGAADQAAVVAHARGFQRVLRVAPRPDVAETLLGLGLTSATQINALGEQQFFTRATAAGLTKPEANAAFQAAAQRYASVISLYMKVEHRIAGSVARRASCCSVPTRRALCTSAATWTCWSSPTSKTAWTSTSAAPASSPPTASPGWTSYWRPPPISPRRARQDHRSCSRSSRAASPSICNLPRAHQCPPPTHPQDAVPQ